MVASALSSASALDKVLLTGNFCGAEPYLLRHSPLFFKQAPLILDPVFIVKSVTARLPSVTQQSAKCVCENAEV